MKHNTSITRLSAITSLLYAMLTTMASAEPKPIISNGERMLFVGNSYMANEGGVFNYFKKALLDSNSGIKIATEQHIYYGKPLRMMMEDKVTSAIQSKKYDSVVITSGEIETMKRFNSLINQAGLKTIIFMTWDGMHPGHQRTVKQYSESTKRNVKMMRKMEKDTNAIIVPIAIVYHDLTLNPPEGLSRVDYLWKPGNIHQNELGTMVNTWMLYAILTGKSPVGLDFDFPPFVTGEKLKTNQDIHFDSSLRLALQQRVWKVAEAWKAGKTQLD